MKRIIMVGPKSTGKGGISTVIKNFIDYFPNNQKYQIRYFFSWNEKGKLFYAFRAFCQLFKATHTREVAIVHFHVSQDASFYRKALLIKAIKKGTKIIFHMHAPNFEAFYNDAAKFEQRYICKVLDRVNLIVALGDDWKEYYQTLTKTKVIVVNNAVFVPQENSYQASSTNVLTFGRICERKGSQDILLLAKRIQRKMPELRFHLYGDTDDTTSKIIDRMKRLNCENVELHGWTTNQEELLKDCGLHLLSSYHEGIPMAILETMGCGIPNMATNVGGIGQVINHQENGFLVTPGDIDQMEQAIISFFSNLEKRKRFSINAKQTIHQHYSLEAYLSTWICVYDSLAD